MKHVFGYRFLKENGIDPSLFSLSGVIADLRARSSEKKKEHPKLFAKLETLAVVESVEGSNAIEGIYTTAERMKAIVEDGAEPLTHSEKEIAGYHDAAVYVKEHFEELDFNENTVRMLHRLLTGRLPNARGGEYKKADNIIAETNAKGAVVRVLFSPTPASETEEAMKNLFLAYQVARDDYDIAPLLLIPCLIVDFLSIHPFADGNGRVSRLLMLLLLYKNGFDIGRFISFEGMINQYKENYYESLYSAQKQWHENENDYRPFITFTFQILYQCYKEMNRRLLYAGKKQKAIARIEAVISTSFVPLSKEEIASLLPDLSLSSIELQLRNLLEAEKIKKIGTYRNARYLKK